MVIAAGGIDLCTVLDVGSVGSGIGGAPSPNSGQCAKKSQRQRHEGCFLHYSFTLPFRPTGSIGILPELHAQDNNASPAEASGVYNRGGNNTLT